ncbi:helix-turn-helix domain-containing protein [Catenulispora pinisilvae]|uniref:helix-turn-helix domain-containing protein n=1 Tax=Catenulispora pinisilvae TaxID=2705253 RepID=UPI001891F8BF|nr:helix-turn-helix domain-containing protein [Catenulispora pinisilvae]
MDSRNGESAESTMPSTPQSFTVAEVAARYRVDNSTIYREIKGKRITIFRVGPGQGAIRISRHALEAYEARVTVEAETVA